PRNHVRTVRSPLTFPTETTLTFATGDRLLSAAPGPLVLTPATFAAQSHVGSHLPARGHFRARNNSAAFAKHLLRVAASNADTPSNRRRENVWRGAGCRYPGRAMQGLRARVRLVESAGLHGRASVQRSASDLC